MKLKSKMFYKTFNLYITTEWIVIFTFILNKVKNLILDFTRIISLFISYFMIHYYCHSEERSDEESHFLNSNEIDSSLRYASFRMTNSCLKFLKSEYNFFKSVLQLNLITIIIFLIPLIIYHSSSQNVKLLEYKIRGLTDSVGYASSPRQLENFFQKVNDIQGNYFSAARKKAGIKEGESWKVAISPHDDYSYVGYLYPALFENIRTPLVIIIGVCHKAKQFGLENKIVFDTYSNWTGPYSQMDISPIRKELISKMPKDMYLINDSVQQVEHSVEALIPFIQFFNNKAKIVSILVPYMSFKKMEKISNALSSAIFRYVQKNKLMWGKDFSIIISNDAVHYGDSSWGGKNYARFGTDSAGYKKAVDYEHEIIQQCFQGNLSKENIRKFVGYTVKEEDFREYKWTWCGRYSVPFGLLTALALEKKLKTNLNSTLIGYETSINRPHIPVTESMGTTALANLHHWVGYAAIGWK